MTLLYGCTEDGSLVGLGTGLLADIAASIRVGDAELLHSTYYSIYLVRFALFLSPDHSARSDPIRSDSTGASVFNRF